MHRPLSAATEQATSTARSRTCGARNARDDPPDAVLPPHVSNLLGISPEEREVPVKQFVEMGALIRGFEVSTSEHNNVVIFFEDRAKKETTFYLTSRRGVLRRVLSVREGIGYGRVPNKADKDAFEKEKQDLVDKLVPKHP